MLILGLFHSRDHANSGTQNRWIPIPEQEVDFLIDILGWTLCGICKKLEEHGEIQAAYAEKFKELKEFSKELIKEGFSIRVYKQDKKNYRKIWDSDND